MDELKSATTSPIGIALPGRLGAAKQLFEWGLQLRNWYRTRTRWSVSVDSNNTLYDVAHTWFRDAAQDVRPQAVSARARSNGNLVSTPDDPETQQDTAIELYWNDRRERQLTIGGFPISVNLERPQASGSGDRKEWGYPSAPDTIHFHASSYEGQQAVVAMLEGLAAKRDRRRPALHLMTSWGGWERRDDLPERSLESVVLVAGQSERVCADLQAFLDSELEYVRRGLPWHRGYLFYGPPGTGKTSLVRALAAHFGLDLWYAPLGDLSKDNNLLTLVNQVSSRSILLLEDVDVYHAATRRGDEETGEGRGATVAGLLNALDGVATPHGLITVMTTNDIGVLDPALLRPGRIDRREELGLLKPEQLSRLWAQYYGRDRDAELSLTYKIGGPGSSAADAMELFKLIADPWAAAGELGRIGFNVLGQTTESRL